MTAPLPTSRPAPRRTGFTLIELLVSVAIIGGLIGLLLPALSAAREMGKAICCASHLRQFGVAIGTYSVDHQEHLPYIDSALWQQGKPFNQDWEADPTDKAAHPHSMLNVLGPWMNSTTYLRCPSAVAGYPLADPKVTYRIASADNGDGVPQTIDQLVDRSTNTADKAFGLKYLNGRPDRVESIKLRGFRWVVVPEPGPFYLFRDFVDKFDDGTALIPHQGEVNQLFIDLSVDVFREDGDAGHAFPDDRRGN